MKKIFGVLGILFFFVQLNAQENNPFNKEGKNLIASIDLIKSDFKNSKITDFSKEAIEEYTKKLPLKVEANLDLVTSVYTEMKSGKLNTLELIQNSKFSDQSKEVLVNISSNPKKFDSKKMKEYLINVVDEIQNSEIASSEKEVILTLVSTVYNQRESAEPCDCTAVGPNGSAPVDCTTCGVIIGGIIGWMICGPWCSLGGAIIGGIVGAMS